MTSEQNPVTSVLSAMPLASWTICSTCCEAHPSAQACIRCAVPEVARRAPAPADPARRMRAQLPANNAQAQAAAPAARSASGATILTAMVFLCGLLLVVVGMMPVLGITLCALPVAVQSVIRVRERRAERAALQDLGLRLTP
jgi:hypothetical protein